MKIKIFSLILVIFFLAGCQTVSKLPLVQENEPGSDTSATSSGKTDSTASKPVAEEIKPTVTVKIPAKPTNNNAAAETKQPVFFDLKVGWGGQAPYANWDALHEEACEEASMIMASYYFKGLSLTAHLTEQGILSLIKWEEAHGYQVDVSADETVTILDEYFNLKSQASNQVSVEKIKSELLKGNLVLIPAAGRLLGNPNFKGEGPIYHMLVIRGWDDKTGEFITNDPGTRKGDGYRYKYAVLLNAVHDWNAALASEGMTNEEMAQGRKVIIIVNK
ncbi:MAG: C39 family peptidase [Candidatus Buchananbacteria bacterium]